jgi:hypothetical protein
VTPGKICICYFPYPKAYKRELEKNAERAKKSHTKKMAEKGYKKYQRIIDEENH